MNDQLNSLDLCFIYQPFASNQGLITKNKSTIDSSRILSENSGILH